jgi:type IV pilus assembly protein PilM
VAKLSGIGLDIGSSAVRAAEVVNHGGHREIVKFAQVGLPAGAVIEGEIREPGAVAAAIKRLWAEGGFKRRAVVLGVSSQRAMVRQIEVPQMSPGELRSALRYQIGELLPIPVEQAVFDFAVLGPGEPGAEGATTRLLVAAAQQDIVKEAIGVVKRGGLRVRAVDPSPLALLRAFPPGPDGGLEAVVCLGAQLVVVGVRQGTTPRFLRTVTLNSGTETSRAALEPAQAVHGADEARRGLGGVGTGPRLDPVVEEVRSSIEYFLSHNQGEHLERVVVTGGAALTSGLVERIRAALHVPVTLATVGPKAVASQLKLSDEQMQEASVRWATAVGLALWKTAPGPAPSLLPAEIKERLHVQQALLGSAAGVMAVALGLGVVSYSGAQTASHVKAQIVNDNTQALALQGEIGRLSVVTRLRGQVVTQRQLAVTALQGDVAWVNLVHRIAAALPAGVTVTALGLARNPPVAASAAPVAAAGTGTSPYVGTISISGQTINGPKSVSAVIEALSAVRGVGAVWVPNTIKSAATPDGTGTSSGSATGSSVSRVSTVGSGTSGSPAAAGSSSAGSTSFTLDADITSAALDDRSAGLPGGGK